jgi:hypothetical protein
MESIGALTKVGITPEEISNIPFLRPYKDTSTIFVLKADEETCWAAIYELHNNAPGALEQVVGDLKAIGIESEWQLDMEQTADMYDDEEGQPELRDIEWPIEDHHRTCTCRVCSLLRVVYHGRQRKDKANKYGWTGDIVSSDPGSPTSFNAHTHNPSGKMDLQIVLPIPQGLANHIFFDVWNRREKGEKVEPGVVMKDVWKGDTRSYDVTFIKAKESDREVIRIIIPDVHGNLTPEQFRTSDSHGDFLLQYEV